jgi:hypothetical protein
MKKNNAVERFKLMYHNSPYTRRFAAVGGATKSIFSLVMIFLMGHFAFWNPELSLFATGSVKYAQTYGYKVMNTCCADSFHNEPVPCLDSDKN